MLDLERVGDGVVGGCALFVIRWVSGFESAVELHMSGFM